MKVTQKVGLDSLYQNGKVVPNSLVSAGIHFVYDLHSVFSVIISYVQFGLMSD